jgi:hypothetical protein
VLFLPTASIARAADHGSLSQSPRSRHRRPAERLSCGLKIVMTSVGGGSLLRSRSKT